jgi:CheY-like chemotaxis protein
VDDLKISVKITQAALEKAGFACDTAANGNEAVALARATPYSLILMDVQVGRPVS